MQIESNVGSSGNVTTFLANDSGVEGGAREAELDKENSKRTAATDSSDGFDMGVSVGFIVIGGAMSGETGFGVHGGEEVISI